MGYRTAVRIGIVALFLMVIVSPGRAQEVPADDALPRGAVARFGTTRFRMGTFIDDLAFSPNGKLLAVTAGGRTRFLDPSSGKLRFVVEGRSPVFSPDCAMVVTIVSSGELSGAEPEKSVPVIHDAASGKVLRQVDPGKLRAGAAAFSPDNKLLAVAMGGGSIGLFDVGTGKSTAQLRRNEPWVAGDHRHVLWSADGKTIVSVCNGLVLEWDVAKGAVRKQTPDGAYGEAARAFIEPGSTTARAIFGTATFSRDGRCLASAVLTSTSIGYPEAGWRTETELSLTDRTAGKSIDAAKGLAEIRAIEFSPDGRILVTGGADCAVRFWNADTGKPISDPAVPDGALFAAAISPDTKMVAIGGIDKVIRVLQYPSGKLIQSLCGHGTTVVALAFSPDSRRLVSCDRSPEVAIWSLESGTVIHKWKPNRAAGPVYSSARWSGDGSLVAVQGAEAPILMNATNGEIFKGYDVAPYPPLCAGLTLYRPNHWITWSHDRRPLPQFLDQDPPLEESARRRSDIRGRSGRQTQLLWSACVGSPDGKTLLVSHRDTLRIYSRDEGAELRRILPKADGEEGRPVHFIRQIGFSPDGNKAVVVQDATPFAVRGGRMDPPAETEQVIRVFNTGDWTEVQTFRGHNGRCNSLSFQGHYAITASQDGTALAWDLNTAGTPKPALPGDPDALWAAVVGLDAEAAAEAVAQLAKDPKAAVARVTACLDQPSDDKEVASLVSQLAEDDFVRRFGAMQTLADWRRSRPGTELALVRFALREATPEAPRKRALMLIEGIDPVMHGGPTVLSRDRDRLYRLITLLERTGDPAAGSMLQRFAQWLPERRGASAAREALKQLTKAGVAVAPPAPVPSPPRPATTRSAVPAPAPIRATPQQVRALAALASAPVKAQIEHLIADYAAMQQQVLADNSFEGRLVRGDVAGAYELARRAPGPQAWKPLMLQVAVVAEQAGNRKVAVDAYWACMDFADAWSWIDPRTNPSLALPRLGRSDLVALAADKLTTAQFEDASRPLNVETIVNAMLAAGDTAGARSFLSKCEARLPQPVASDNLIWVTGPRTRACVTVARLQARVKDAAGAARSLARASAHLKVFDPKMYGVQAELTAATSIAGAYAEAGLQKEYQAEVQRITQGVQGLSQAQLGYNVLASLAWAQANAGDAAGALATLKPLSDPAMLAKTSPAPSGAQPSGWDAYIAIARAQWRAGDRKAAEQSFEQAIALGAALNRPQADPASAAVAWARAELGDLDGALQTVKKARAPVPPEIVSWIAGAFAQSGDVAGALRTIDAPHDDPHGTARNNALITIAERLFKSGDVAGALAVYAASPTRNFGGSQYPVVLLAAARSGDVELVLKHLDTAYETTIRELASARVQAGDRASAQRIIERGLEAGLASPPNIHENLWSLIELLSEVSPKDAQAVGEVYQPRTGIYLPRRDPAAEAATIALQRFRAADTEGAMAHIRSVAEPGQRDQAILLLSEKLLAPSDTLSGNAATRPSYRPRVFDHPTTRPNEDDDPTTRPATRPVTRPAQPPPRSVVSARPSYPPTRPSSRP